MLPDQVPGYVQGGPARIDPRAALREPFAEAVPLSVGALGELAQVQVDSLGAPHQRTERGAAKRRLRAAARGRRVNMGHEPGVCGPGGGGDLRIGVGRNARGQPAGGPGERLADRSGHRVERGDRRVNGGRPGREVYSAGPIAVGLRRVLPVVAGQVHVADVEVRIAPVQLEVAEADPRGVLENSQLRLIVLVRQAVAGGGLGDPAQTSPDSVRGQVLDPAVVLVPAAVLPDFSNGHVPDGAQPGVGVSHARHLTGGARRGPAGG